MTECPECGLAELEPRMVIEDNEPVENGTTCPECNAEFGDGVVLDWDDVDWPVWIRWESYNDTWDFYRKFLRLTGLHEEVAGDLRNMKYTVFHVWFKVNSDGSIDGPFENKHDDEELDL